MDEIVRAVFRGEMEAFLPPYSEKSRQNQAFVRAEDLAERMKQEIPAEYHFVLNEYEQAVMELMDAAEDEYVSGYRLGVRMMIAAWPQEQEP